MAVRIVNNPDENRDLFFEAQKIADGLDEFDTEQPVSSHLITHYLMRSVLKRLGYSCSSEQLNECCLIVTGKNTEYCAEIVLTQLLDDCWDAEVTVTAAPKRAKGAGRKPTGKWPAGMSGRGKMRTISVPIDIVDDVMEYAQRIAHDRAKK